MAGFLSKRSKAKTPEERAHQASIESVKGWDDDVLQPEMREYITQGKFIQIKVVDGDSDEDSSLLLLGKGEMCLFFAKGLLAMQEEALSGFRGAGTSYDALLAVRNQRLQTGAAQAVYRTEHNREGGILILTNKRMMFLPITKTERRQVIEAKLDEILSLRVVDNALLIIQTKAGVFPIYVKWPVMFEKVLKMIRKSKASDFKDLDNFLVRIEP